MRQKLVLLLAAAYLAAGCGGSEHGEFEKALRRQYRMMDEFTVAVADASGPDEIVDALEKFQSEAVAGRERMLRLMAAHPALADLEKATLPEEVKAELVRIEEATPRFVEAMLRVEREYGGDPEVRRALDEVGTALSTPAR